MTAQSLQTKYYPAGTLWPSGDFSCGSKRVLLVDAAEVNGPQWNPDEYMGVAPPHTPTLDAIPMWLSDLPARVQVYQEMQEVWENPGAFEGAAAPLDLTDAPNPHKRSNRPESYGRKGITGFGRRMVRSACTILERAYKGRLTFCTITMPTLPPELKMELAKQWPELVRQMLQWLSRRLAQRRLPTAVASVSEIQPKRLQAGNGGYLHLHLVWPNKIARKGHYAIDVDALRTWCEKFLCTKGLMVENAWVNVDTKRVKKSAAAYLSKYMSKGGDVLEQFVGENGWEACPGQWWNMTKTMRDKVKSEVCKGETTGKLLHSLVEYAFNCDDFTAFWFLHHVDMEIDDKFITVGYFGALKLEVVADLAELHVL
jgi:hypothetical protein